MLILVCLLVSMNVTILGTMGLLVVGVGLDLVGCSGVGLIVSSGLVVSLHSVGWPMRRRLRLLVLVDGMGCHCHCVWLVVCI